MLEMATDISQVRRLRAKLTSIGLLVASLSHRIKGHLSGLDGGLYLVNSGFSRGDSDRVERGDGGRADAGVLVARGDLHPVRLLERDGQARADALHLAAVEPTATRDDEALPAR